MTTNEVLDLCPKCNTEGDPIQAVHCLPVKWCCPECGTKWTAQGIVSGDEIPVVKYL